MAEPEHFHPEEVYNKGKTGAAILMCAYDSEGKFNVMHFECTIADDTRRFNLNEGLKPEDDNLPRRLHLVTLPETGKAITAEQMDVMLKQYYQARGWDQLGRPVS